MYDCDFFVFANSDQFDVIFGVEYIVANDLLEISKDAMAPLTEHTKLTVGEYLMLSLFTYENALSLEYKERKPP